MPQKHRDTYGLPESLPDLLRLYARTLRRWSEALPACPECATPSENARWRTVTMDYLKSAGALVRVLLSKGAFPEIGSFLLPAYDILRRERRYPELYTELWINFAGKLETWRYPSSHLARLKTLSKDCRLVADELEKEARAIGLEQRAGPGSIELSGGGTPATGGAHATEPGRKHSQDYVFRRNGDYWRIIYEGHDLGNIKDLRGIGYIHYLIKHKNEVIGCINLEKALRRNGGGGGSAEAAAIDKAREQGDLNLKVLNQQDLETQRAYLSHLKHQQEKEQDPGSKAELKEQLDNLERHIQKQVDIHGRARSSGPSENARKRVSGCINSAKKRLASHDENFGVHLQAVRPAQYAFKYEPDRNVGWILE